jgi:hypothetical protein
VTIYSAGLPTNSPTPELGRAFTRFLTMPAFRARLAAAGLDYQERPRGLPGLPISGGRPPEVFYRGSSQTSCMRPKL